MDIFSKRTMDYHFQIEKERQKISQGLLQSIISLTRQPLTADQVIALIKSELNLVDKAIRELDSADPLNHTTEVSNP